MQLPSTSPIQVHSQPGTKPRRGIGVDSIEAYGSLQSLLAELTIVEGFAIKEIAGDRITYRVDVRGGADRLGRALTFSGLIEKTGNEGAAYPLDAVNSRLEFFYSP